MGTLERMDCSRGIAVFPLVKTLVSLSNVLRTHFSNEG